MIDISQPGFADPVRDAQSCFRAVLAAMSRPGSVHRLTAALQPPIPLHPATAAVLLTLIDFETTLWIDPRLAAAAPWIAFHCGAQIRTAIQDARFVLATALPDIETLDRGSDEAPEDSATVILQIDDLDEGPTLRIAGPGLASPSGFRPTGLPENFPTLWRANHALYPCGIDLIFCAGGSLASLPRSVEVS